MGQRERTHIGKGLLPISPLIGKGLLPIFEQPHTKSTNDED
jgi:hypothetical protein